MDLENPDKVRQKLSHSIDDFKKTVLDSLAMGAQKEPEITIDVYVPPQAIAKPDLVTDDFVPSSLSSQARVYVAGIDNLVNSTVRAFLQKIGAYTFAADLQERRQAFIEDQFYTQQKFDFAVVILSPDEYMFQKIQDPQHALLVSAPKTVFDLGFLVGKLGRNRVVVFYEEIDKFKRPTEYFDLLYVPFDASGRWQEKLMRHIKFCGVPFKPESPTAVQS